MKHMPAFQLDLTLDRSFNHNLVIKSIYHIKLQLILILLLQPGIHYEKSINIMFNEMQLG